MADLTMRERMLAGRLYLADDPELATIGDNVWLGGGEIVCPGVTIGANTVVGAGSEVIRGLPPDVVAVGNPARVIKAGEA